MSLIQDVERVCRRLAPLGWGELFAAHGLDITAANLARELARPLRRINRKLPGFEDFCAEGNRGVEPGSPAESLLYHALASSAVVAGPKGALRSFPTLAELATVENYVFAARRATLASIRALAGDAPLAIAVYACEYRTAPRTAHKRYADLTCSRTGLCRIGTAPPRYDARLRGFSPLVAGRTDRIRVSPARFAAFLAVRLPGAQGIGRPMRYQKPYKHTHTVGDNRRGFWVPLHKLFSGPECLIDVPELTVELAARHFNEKIRRIHLALARRTVHGKRFDSGWTEPDISRPPFRFSEGIAEWSTGEADPPGLMVPVPHKSLVEPASYRGQPLGFNVPSRDGFLASLDITVEHNDQGEEIRSAPAYIHARTKLTPAGEVDLNQFSNVTQLVTQGGYQARHYVDHTGDGWVKAKLGWGKAKPARLARALPAFTVVTAPDYLFACDQAELTEWSDTLSREVRNRIWYMPPTPLSDERLPANLQMPATPFTPDDDTITAVVGLGLAPAKGKPTTALAAPHPIHTSLPDDAAGVMAPGWDVSRDWLPDHRQHLATYGLGSPFPEDTKLCAALSSFWPAVSPDATREFTWPDTQGYKSVTPLTDAEIGVGQAPSWDAVEPPRLVTKDGKQHVIYASFQHTDYALSAVANKLTLANTGLISQIDYADRTLAMGTAYRALGSSGHFRWAVLSYRQVGPDDRERRRAEKATGHVLLGTAHRFAMFLPGDLSSSPRPPFRQQLQVRRRATLLVVPGSDDVLVERLGKWVRKRVNWK